MPNRTVVPFPRMYGGLSGTESAILNRESSDSESCDSNRAIPCSGCCDLLEKLQPEPQQIVESVPSIQKIALRLPHAAVIDQRLWRYAWTDPDLPNPNCRPFPNPWEWCHTLRAVLAEPLKFKLPEIPNSCWSLALKRFWLGFRPLFWVLATFRFRIAFSWLQGFDSESDRWTIPSRHSDSEAKWWIALLWSSCPFCFGIFCSFSCEDFFWSFSSVPKIFGGSLWEGNLYVSGSFHAHFTSKRKKSQGRCWNWPVFLALRSWL